MDLERSLGDVYEHPLEVEILEGDSLVKELVEHVDFEEDGFIQEFSAGVSIYFNDHMSMHNGPELRRPVLVKNIVDHLRETGRLTDPEKAEEINKKSWW